MRKKPNPGMRQTATQPLTARYCDHPNVRFNGNPLIRALSPLPSFKELQRKLTRFPAHAGASERLLDRSMKIARLEELFHLFFVGLPRVVELQETLHTMICEGYVDLVPHSKEDHARRQKLYERRESGSFFDLEDDQDSGSQLSAALVGIPGIGKSRALRRISAPYRRVIYHPELNIYQIPALLIEMPYKGSSINTLAHSIIRALDKLHPQGDYYQYYLAGRDDAEVRFMDAVALMQHHYVGVLLVDESQNRDYRETAKRQPSKAVRGQTPLTTLLLTATNDSDIPMLMCGTPELRDILGTRMSMLRRMVGRGMRTWKPLSLPTPVKGGEERMGEFDVFLKLLWEFQWTKTPFELSRPMRNAFYNYTQGVSDIIVKLFHDVQLRAIRNGGDEVVDLDLLHSVAHDELGALMELTQAMREMDYDRTGLAADLAAYLEIEPHEMNFDREGSSDAPSEPVDDEPPESAEPPEAHRDDDLAEPKEVPTGETRAKTSPRRAKRADKPHVPPPFIPVVAELGAALDS